MSQQIIRTRLQKVTLGVESSYGTTSGSMRDARFKDPGLAIKCMQAQLKNIGQSTRLFDNLKNVQGRKSWEASGSLDLRPENDQLVGVGAVGNSWLQDLLRVCFGGYHADVGSTVASATDGTGWTFASGGGSKFTAGQPCGITHSGTTYWVLITSISTDTVTCWPTLPFTPSASDPVINGYVNWPTESVSETVSVTGVHVDNSGDQYTLNGGVVSELDVNVDLDQLLTATAKLMGKSWTGPSAQSLSTAAITDALINPIHCANATMLLQATTTLTQTVYKLRSAQIKVNLGVDFLNEFTGTNEGTSGIYRAGDRMFASIAAKTRFDSQIETWYGSQTTLALFIVIPYGSGATQRAIVLCVPSCFIETKPEVIDEGNLRVHSFQLSSMLNTLNASLTAGTAAAPFVLGRF